MGDVLSVAFSVDNRQIVSGSRDKTIKLWNTLGECKFTIGEGEGHTEWVSCVRFSPVTTKPIIVSAGWDRLVKVWNLKNCKLNGDLRGHRYYINTVTVSPDGSLCASGGKDGTAMLWDLESKSIVDDLKPEFDLKTKNAQVPYCVSLQWSADGQTLYSGYTDGVLRVWAVQRSG